MRIAKCIVYSCVVGTLWSCAQAPAPLTDDDRAEIRALEQSFAQASLAGDPEAQLAGAAEELVWLHPHHDAIVGLAAVRDHLESGAPSVFPLITFSLSSVRIDGSGDFAYNRGTYSMSFEARGDTVVETGHNLQVLQRGPEGNWRVIMMMWTPRSPDAPPGN